MRQSIFSCVWVLLGQHLTLSHRTASIRNNDGTFEHVAYIPGSAEYIARMQYLATTSGERMHNGERLLPGVDEQDLSTMPAWLWFHLKRYLNKTLLRPADPRFSPLADMAYQLRKEVEKYLGKSITSAAISSPDRVRLTRFELGDIFDYIWLEDLVKDKDNPMFSELYSMSAALAGYGQGLCANYTNSYECYREEEFAPAPWTLQIDFSNHSLSGAAGGRNTARTSSGYMTFANTTLGFIDHQSREFKDADKEYWKKVESQVREFSGTAPPESLLLTGEHASDPRFIRAVKNALSHLTRTPALRSLDGLTEITEEEAKHFLFATSMGAAELAKRRQEGMARCMLRPDCRSRLTREDVYVSNSSSDEL